MTVKAALLTLSPAGTLVMLMVGLVKSTKLACNIKFGSITNCTVGPLVRTLNGRFIPPVQLVNTKPVPAVAVIA